MRRVHVAWCLGIVGMLAAVEARAEAQLAPEAPAAEIASATTQPTSRPVAAAPASAPASQPVAAPATQPGPAGERDPYAGLDHSGTPPEPPRAEVLPAPSHSGAGRRPLPRYRGQEHPGVSAGEGLIWIPRVLFFPAHVVLDYGVRWPLVKAMTLAEEHHVFARVERFFSFSDGRGVVFPTLFFDFGLKPSMGLYTSWADWIARDNDLVLQAGFWPTGWYQVAAKNTSTVFRDGSGTLTTRGQFILRPDYVFAGLGPDPSPDERFFRLRQLELDVSLRAALKKLNRISIGLFYRNTEITGGQSPSLAAVDAPPELTREVPGFGRTHNLLGAELKLELDSRSPDRVFTPGSGVRLEAFGGFSFDPDDVDLRFVRWGAEASGFVDLTGLNHVLALDVYVELLEDVGQRRVPITERIILGGTEHLRGFLAGHFRGDSALEATLAYRYPIWTFLDANLFASFGNVFRGRFEEFSFERFVACWGFGLRSNSSRDVSFDFLLGFGTNQLHRWDDDFAVDNVRLLFGVNQGF